MEPHHFDDLIRSLTASSRRTLLAGLASGLLAAIPAWPDSEAAARKKKRKNANKRNKKRRRKCAGKECGGRCGSCPSGKVCQAGSCVCPGATVDCGGGCVDTNSDPRNCGKCGTRCQLGASCDAGICTCINGGCHIGNVSCCAVPGAEFTCACGGEANVFDPATCTFSTDCPEGTVLCIGGAGQCRTCCPSGTTCDTSTGTCLQ